jgi:DNA-binding MarR family transcriptional regulator
MVAQWARERPDLDVSPMSVIGRVSRLSRIVDRLLAENFAQHGIEAWMYDVLATLRRSGEPFELSPGELVSHTMVTTGAMTNRIDRLTERGYVERHHDPDDRRRVVVRMTPLGRDLVDGIAADHYRFEDSLLSSLSAASREHLVRALRTILVDLGDHSGQAIQDAGSRRQ